LATQETTKLRDGHGRQEEQIHQKLAVAQDWRQEGIKDEQLAAFCEMLLLVSMASRHWQPS
jgi:hypothetical protein